jgi:hypothetical protein
VEDDENVEGGEKFHGEKYANRVFCADIDSGRV